MSQDFELDIYLNREDASKYSLNQLQIILKHDILVSINYWTLLYVAMTLYFIFFHINIDKDYLNPLVKRHTIKKIREFFRLEIRQQELQSTVFDGSSNDQITNSYKCFGINLLYLKEKPFSKSHDVTDQDYESFIREEIHRRGDSIRDMIHNNYLKTQTGVILNKTMKRLSYYFKNKYSYIKFQKLDMGSF